MAGIDGLSDDLRSIPEVAMIMRRARDAGIPYSEAKERWGATYDVAMEFALDAVAAMDALETCPDCGVKPSDQLDDEGRPLEFPRYKFVVHHCNHCEATSELQDLLKRQTEQYAKMSNREAPFVPKIRTMPKGPLDDRAPDLLERLPREE